MRNKRIAVEAESNQSTGQCPVMHSGKTNPMDAEKIYRAEIRKFDGSAKDQPKV